MDLELHDRVALVTGASRGIGAGIARALAAEGCKLVICARGEERLQATARELAGLGVEVFPLALDLTQSGTGERLVAEALDRFGRLDVVVNNVGGNRRKEFAQVTEEDWSDLLALNFHSQVRVARAAVPALRERKSGVILFISSIFGREAGGPGLSLYNTTKSALISVAKIMALELAPDGIRVNSIAPGSIRFPGGGWDERCKREPEAMAEFVRREIPMGRFGTVEEIANVVAFLASDRASWITGACINVDGGQSRSLI